MPEDQNAEAEIKKRGARRPLVTDEAGNRMTDHSPLTDASSLTLVVDDHYRYRPSRLLDG
jgi:hypothetical protein